MTPHRCWPNPDLSYLLTTLAIVMSPLAVAVGTGFNRVMERAPARWSTHGC